MNTKITNMKDYFKTQITSEDESKQFYRKLNSDGLLFHPEDNPNQIINIRKEGLVRLFTDEECKYLNERLDETFEYMTDPCEFIVDELLDE
jgi:hypothetical protein